MEKKIVLLSVPNVFAPPVRVKIKFGGGKCKEWHLVDWMKDSPCPEYRWVYSWFKKTAEHKNGMLDASDGLCAGDGRYGRKFQSQAAGFFRH